MIRASLTAFLLFASVPFGAAHRDDDAVRKPIEEYLKGHATGDASHMRNAFLTIDVVDISGTAATARATLVHGATTFTDYFVLLKVDGEWKIANKVYSAAPTK